MDKIEVSQWRCIRSVIMRKGFSDEYIAFTVGKIYEAEPGAALDGTRMLCFINNQEKPHLAAGRWLFEHFERVEQSVG